MNSPRAKLIVLVVFLLTLGAGITAGLLAARLPNVKTPAPVASPDASLPDQLNLTSEQSAQMQKIWEKVRDLSDQSLTRANAERDIRDEAIKRLIPADKIDQYNKIERDYSEKLAKMKGERQAAFESAVNQTNAILNGPQQKKYKEILANRLGSEAISAHDPAGESAVSPVASQPSQ